jgi:N-methylhydantoinase A
VLSALGLLAAGRRRDTARTVMLAPAEITAERLADEVETLRDSIAGGMEGAEAEVAFELRYLGQSFELPIAAEARPDPGELLEAFAAEHERRYGFRDPATDIELVSISVALREPAPQPRPRAAEAGVERAERRVRFDGEWLTATVLRGEPAAGTELSGPLVLELPETTLVLPPGWAAGVDDHGTVVAVRA